MTPLSFTIRGLFFLFILSNQLNKYADPCEGFYSYLLVQQCYHLSENFFFFSFRQFQAEHYKHP